MIETVEQLIEALQKKDPKAKVVRADNYYGGYEDIVELAEDTITSQFGDTKGQTQKAVVIQ